MVESDMRRYLQGTLDFDCAVYAVINALARLYNIDLAAARHIYQETILALSACPRLWEAYVRNGTDHYWMVRHLLSRWCGKGPWHVRISQPFGDGLLPEERYAALASLVDAPLYLPEGVAYAHAGERSSLKGIFPSSEAVWGAIASWLEEKTRPRALLLRFHRFLPGMDTPIVSHWTCGIRVFGEALFLHDASGEEGALHTLEKNALLTQAGARVRIAPESVTLLEPYVFHASGTQEDF